MNYIYDTFINLNNKYYEYHEWLDVDNIVKIKKIPIIRVNDKTFKDIRMNKTKIFDYTGLLAITNTKSIYVINIVDKINKLFSSLNISEELDLLPMTKEYKETNINYIIIKKINNSYCRIDEEKYKYLMKNINKFDYDKLKYLYLECYNNKETDIEKIKNKIIEDIQNNNTFIIDKIYNIIKLVTTK